MQIRRARPVALIALMFAAWIAIPTDPDWIPQAQAHVRRCTTSDGGTVFTDRLCSEVDATEQVQRAEAGTPLRPYRGGCARTMQDLIHEGTAAIDGRDGNRLAPRPLVDITALRPATQVVVVERPGVSAPVLDEDYYAQTARNRRPTALRIDQMLADGITPSRTIFGLRRHMDCWWI